MTALMRVCLCVFTITKELEKKLSSTKCAAPGKLHRTCHCLGKYSLLVLFHNTVLAIHVITHPSWLFSTLQQQHLNSIYQTPRFMLRLIFLCFSWHIFRSADTRLLCPAHQPGRPGCVLLPLADILFLLSPTQRPYSPPITATSESCPLKTDCFITNFLSTQLKKEAVFYSLSHQGHELCRHSIQLQPAWSLTSVRLQEMAYRCLD